jgi:hypothetical protein
LPARCRLDYYRYLNDADWIARQNKVMTMTRRIDRVLIAALACVLLWFETLGVARSQTSAEAGERQGPHTGERPSTRLKIGIFGFGSLIADPGEELANATASRIEAETPFAVEYGRTSKRTRGGAPTLVPVKNGGTKVKATIFVLKDSVSEQEARDILWRRETRQVGSGKTYKRPAHPGPSSVLVATCKNFMGLDRVLYTDFADSGKLTNPTAGELARLAMESAKNHDVPDGMDGISYLMAAKKAGIVTPLSADYEKEILRMTGASSLEEALTKVRGAPISK